MFTKKSRKCQDSTPPVVWCPWCEMAAVSEIILLSLMIRISSPTYTPSSGIIDHRRTSLWKTSRITQHTIPLKQPFMDHS